ncbi:hypothetical protein TNCV_897211 [Trichonephila clavipes]|nr:hypothetical protein TNCV_897211 [Trichonephila clavipes]
MKLPCRKSNIDHHTGQAKAVLVVITYQTGIGISEREKQQIAQIPLEEAGGCKIVIIFGTYVLSQQTRVSFYIMSPPAGWRAGFAAGLLHPRLRVRLWPKSVDFRDAENQQRSCRTIIRHVKDPQSVCLVWTSR